MYLTITAAFWEGLPCIWIWNINCFSSANDLTLYIRTIMNKEEMWKSLLQRDNPTELNEAHGSYVIGSNLCCFLWGRISRRLHCRGSNTFSFLPSSLCSREQSIFHIFYLSCSSLKKSHVLLVVYLPVQKNSVPLLAFHFYSPITYLKNSLTSGRPTHFALCSCPSLQYQNQEQNLFFFLFQGEAISKEFAETGVWKTRRRQFLVFPVLRIEQSNYSRSPERN